MKLIWLIWDGCERTVLKRLLKEDKLPNLASLPYKIDIDVGCLTETRPAHAEMFTGYDWRVTGIKSNTHWDYPPSGLSIFERLHVYSAMILGKSYLNIGFDSPQMFGPWRPGLATYPGNGRWTREQVTQYVINHMCCADNWLLLGHYKQPDYIGHRHGSQSPEYETAIKHNDTGLNRIMEAAPPNTHYLVVTDHGFDQGGPHSQHVEEGDWWLHWHAPNAWAVSDLPLLHNGTMVDIAPTVYDTFKIDWKLFQPPLKGNSLTEEKAIFDLDEQPKPELIL